MSDAHLNKCKDCTKLETCSREKEVRKNPEWVEKEKARCREKNLKRKKVKVTPETSAEYLKKWKLLFPEKYLARCHSNIPKNGVKGMHMHHWSYNEDHWQDTIPLLPKLHMKLHRFLAYDQERMMYRRIDTNELLDSKEIHIAYFELIKNKP